MMQYSSRNPCRGSPESAEEAAAYNSFIDIAGFATSGRAASFAASSSPSHSTSTYNGSPPNNGSKMDINNSNFHFHSSLNDKTYMTVQDYNVEEEEEYNGVDWPVEEEKEPMDDRQKMLLAARLPPPPPPTHPPPHPKMTIKSSRNQQIFRAKGTTTTSGSTGTPTFHSDQGSKGSKSPNNKNYNFRDGRKIVVATGDGGGSNGIVFESFETTPTSIAQSAENNRPRNGGMRGNSTTATTATTTIFDNIAKVVAARTLDTTATTSLVGNNDRSKNVPNDRQRNINTNINTSPTIANTASKKSLPLPSPSSSSSPEQTTSRSSPQSEFRRTGMVNKLVSMFSNKQQQQQQQQQSLNIQPTMHTFSSKQPKTTVSGGVQFQVPISTKLQTQTPAGNGPALTTNPAPTPPSSLLVNENYFTHPAISPARSNTQSSVTGASGDSSSYNPTGWPGTVDRRGRTYVMEPSYSEEDSSNSWASPRRATAAAATRKEQGSIVHGSINTALAAPFTAANTMENWHHDSVVDSISVYDNGDEEGGDNWRQQRKHSSKIRTAADVQLKAVLVNNQFRHDRQTAMNRHNGGMQSNRTPPTNSNSSLEDDANIHGIDLSGSEERIRASGRRLASPKVSNAEFNSAYSFDSRNNSYSRQRMLHSNAINSGQHALSDETLRMKDSQTSPPREGGSYLFRGYRGFIDKTKDVPNLMDDAESEGGTSMGTGVYSISGDARRHQHRVHHAIGLALPPSSRGTSMSRQLSVAPSSNTESASDVFEGIVQEEQFGPIEEGILNVNSEEEYRMPLKAASFHGENLPYSTQFNPFSVSCLPPEQRNDFERSHGLDTRYLGPALNLSAVTRGSSDSSPHYFDYTREEEDGFESLPDLTIYYIQPDMVQKLVRAFRKICTNQMEISSSEDTMLHDFENLVDTKKTFALFEMRSRIMETDIDRGLDRKGGTNVEDDIVLTPYFQAAARVRDAVIVSKAWRDGATPKDVITAHLLTRRSAKAHFVPRPINRIRRHGVAFFNDEPGYWLEEVRWLDDTDFMLMRCQSLGAGTMKGFEMFTIGDCQSMLLKMTSDNCTVLRRELRSAMTRQIEAEELMQEEIDLDGDENIVAEAEQLHEAATLEVRSLSMKLVLADKSFALVRNQMQKLVETIETLLSQVDNSDDSASDGEECDDDSCVSDKSHERQRLVNRATRAELSAELAVREAILAKQEAAKIKSEKQREIDYLKVKIAEMETQSQILASEHQKSFYDRQAKSSNFLDEAKSFLESTFENEDASRKKQRLKQQFHERRLASNPVGEK